MSYKPGDIAYFTIPVQNPATGAAINADSTPTVIIRRNGTLDAAVTPTVAASGTTGLYNASFTIPSGYAAGDTVGALAQVVVGGVTSPYVAVWRQILDSKRLFDLNDITAASVWAVGTRTLSSFGTLASDVWAVATRTLTTTIPTANDVRDAVWANSTRTLTGFGTLVSDIWSNASRTLSAFSFTVNTNANSTETAIKVRTDLIPASPATEGNVTAVGNAVTAVGGAVAGLNNLSATGAQNAATAALNAYDPPTRTEATADKEEVLDAIGDIDTGGVGTGAWTQRFTVLDAGGDPIERATVRLQSGINNKRGLTDADGYLEIPANNGTWHYAVDKSGYDGKTDELVVTSDNDVPVELTLIVLPLPADPDLVTVYGNYGFLGVYEEGVAVSAKITGNGPGGNRPVFLDSTLQNIERLAQTTTDANGAWTLNLAVLPSSHYWVISVGGKSLKVVLTEAMVGTSVPVEDVIAPTC